MQNKNPMERFLKFCLDLDEQQSRAEPGYDEAIIKKPNYKDLSFDYLYKHCLHIFHII